MRLCVLWVFAAVLSAAMPVPSREDQAGDLRVLFIGNSLTSVNDLPRLVEDLAARENPRMRVAMVAKNDFSLDDHWQEGTARKAIERGGWSFVVLQQGPSALPESRVQLRASVAQFDAIIRKAGARPALYMVWPSLARKGDFDRVRESYAIAASDVNGLFIPAGEAWRAAWKRDSTIALYSQDGLHPTPQASYLAALVVASRLTGRDVSSLAARPPGWPADWLPPDRARVLEEAAAETVRAVDRKLSPLITSAAFK